MKKRIYIMTMQAVGLYNLEAEIRSDIQDLQDNENTIESIDIKHAVGNTYFATIIYSYIS